MNGAAMNGLKKMKAKVVFVVVLSCDSTRLVKLSCCGFTDGENEWENIGGGNLEGHGRSRI